MIGRRWRKKLGRVFAAAPGQEQRIGSVLQAFSRGLKAHPGEWPIARRSSPELTFQFSGVEIRYRIPPSDQSVEILSVSAPGIFVILASAC